MPDIPLVDVAGRLPDDLMHRSDLWPAGPQRGGGYTSARGLSAFASHSEYAEPTVISTVDSDERLHLSVWLRDGIEVDAEGRRFQVAGRQTVAGFMPGARWTTRFAGSVHHVGLLLRPDSLAHLAGEDGVHFFEQLQRDGALRVDTGDGATLKVAAELDTVLLTPRSLPLLREAKALELLACLIQARQHRPPSSALPLRVRENLQHARQRLLQDFCKPPTLEQLASECGLNTFALKQGFKQMFGEPVFALYQRERMRVAWDLIASGRMSASEAGREIGYANMSHFGSAFRRSHGMLPSEVRRRAAVVKP